MAKLRPKNCHNTKRKEPPHSPIPFKNTKFSSKKQGGLVCENVLKRRLFINLYARKSQS
jgi:hypothetical protein